MRLLVGTNNSNKFEEIKKLMPEKFELVSQAELTIPSPEESGLTFVENAIIKARHASNKSGLPTIADDSGLIVDSLGGKPGVFSSRFGGPDATDTQNCKKLLKEMEGEKVRTACFHCVLVFVRNEADPTPYIAQGMLKGEILEKPAGKGGFGYDPIFFLPEYKKTIAELHPSEKNKISHRAEAIHQLTRMI
tara:strand:- start:317 stop:889 length:573 start_codon:yes stop_codon:yes gene_type:complete